MTTRKDFVKSFDVDTVSDMSPACITSFCGKRVLAVAADNLIMEVEERLKSVLTAEKIQSS